jgi:hypothetical protein
LTVEDEKAAVRATIFTHLSGIVLAPTVAALADRGAFRLFESSATWIALNQICEQTHANRGYLRVALRLLTSCGWLRQRTTAGQSHEYALTPEGLIGAALAAPLYREVISFIPKALFLEDFLYGKFDGPVLPSLQSLVARTKERWLATPQDDPVTVRVAEDIRGHLDGVLIGPAMVALARGGVLAQLEQGAVETRSLAGNRASLN